MKLTVRWPHVYFYKDLGFGPQLKVILEKEGGRDWLLINGLNLMS